MENENVTRSPQIPQMEKSINRYASNKTPSFLKLEGDDCIKTILCFSHHLNPENVKKTFRL